jgi:hypothetical protein
MSLLSGSLAERARSSGEGGVRRVPGITSWWSIIHQNINRTIISSHLEQRDDYEITTDDGSLDAGTPCPRVTEQVHHSVSDAYQHISRLKISRMGFLCCQLWLGVMFHIAVFIIVTATVIIDLLCCSLLILEKE